MGQKLWMLNYKEQRKKTVFPWTIPTSTKVLQNMRARHQISTKHFGPSCKSNASLFDR